MSVTLHTSRGDIKIQLECERVGSGCANFLALCASGVYNGIEFHRVIPGFIIQTGGRPSTKSSTSLGSYGAIARRLPDQIHPELRFDHEGMVAYANAGKPSRKGIGSQFFITLEPTPHLDDTCTIFGRVINGMKVINNIADTQVDDQYQPKEKVILESVSIHANPFANGDIPYPPTSANLINEKNS